MKKLLGILGAIAFTASVSSTVVACGTTSSKDKHKLYSTINWSDGNEEVLKLADGQIIRVKDFKQLASSSMDDYLMDQVNGMVANRYASDYNDNTINSDKNLGLISKNRNYSLQGSKTNGYASEIDNLNFTSLSTDLYQTYVNDLSTTNPLDQIAYDKSSLNPVWYGDDYNGTRDYSLWFKPQTGEPHDDKFIRWTTARETDISTMTVGTDYLPTAADLNKSDFYLVKSTTLPTGDNGSLFENESDLSVTDIKSLNPIESNITGQQALMYRFQDYLQNQNASNMINALVMEYEKNTLYKLQKAPTDPTIASKWETATDKSLYVDTSSTIAKAIQSWPAKVTDPITSNYKMVWRVSLPDADIDTTNSDIKGLVNLNDTLSGKNFAVFNKGETLSDVFSKITKSGDQQSKKGASPFFDGTDTGYQGIIKDGKAIDGGTLNLNSTVAGEISKTEGFGVMQGQAKTDGTPTFGFDPAKGNGEDFIIVMPLYLMDLLRTPTSVSDSPSTPDPLALNNIAMKNWVELQPQNGSSFKSTDKFDFSNSGLSPWDSKKVDSLPTTNAYMQKDGKSYIYIYDNSETSFSVKDGSNTITIKPHDASTDKNDKSGFGVSGVFSNPSGKDAAQFNGQKVNYAIHLGSDNTNPNSYETNWVNSHADQNVTDIANLSNTQKTSLMDTLFAIVAKNDSGVQEETKNAIYRNYINLNDIVYKGLYDKISKYLKEDDSTDPTD